MLLIPVDTVKFSMSYMHQRHLHVIRPDGLHARMLPATPPCAAG